MQGQNYYTEDLFGGQEQQQHRYTWYTQVMISLTKDNRNYRYISVYSTLCLSRYPTGRTPRPDVLNNVWLNKDSNLIYSR